MLLSILIVFLIAVGGMGLTYVFEKEESFLWRLAAGNVIGSAVFGTLVFVFASFAGFIPAIVPGALAVTLLPCLLLLDKDRRKIFTHDWAKAKGKLQGANLTKAARFAYYAFFLALFLAFFERAMIVSEQGIFTGGSNSLGDLPFHLGAIFSFTDGNNFPPQNPTFAGARFSYPFIADFLTASFVKLGTGVREAMLVQNISWAFSLLIILERFVFKLTYDRLASKIAPALLFFSGGLGFIWFFGDYWAQGKGFFDFIWTLPKDYTIGQDFRWGNSMVSLFMTQRSILLGMPLTLIFLTYLWKIFTAETPRRGDPESTFSNFHIPCSTLTVGLIAGLLPLIHLHSLAVLFVVTLFLFAFRLSSWRDWVVFGLGVTVIAVPQLLWSISGSATETSKFFEFYFGWNMPGNSGLPQWNENGNFSSRIMTPSIDLLIRWIIFWFKNTGLLIPVTVAGVFLIYSMQTDKKTGKELTPNGKGIKERNEIELFLIPHPSSPLLFYIPFVFLFLIGNIAKLAPWEWDNIKVLIYWFIGSIPFVAFALGWMWRKTLALRIVAAVCFFVLIFSGALDVWRTVSRQINYRVFDPDAVIVAERIKQRTPPNSLFLNAPTYNSAVVLSGRQSLMRYTGHLFSHGIEYAERERDVKNMYAGGAAASVLLQKYGIDYVLISPEERNAVGANEAFFGQFSVIAEAGQYKVYKIK